MHLCICNNHASCINAGLLCIIIDVNDGLIIVQGRSVRAFSVYCCAALATAVSSVKQVGSGQEVAIFRQTAGNLRRRTRRVARMLHVEGHWHSCLWVGTVCSCVMAGRRQLDYRIPSHTHKILACQKILLSKNWLFV